MNGSMTGKGNHLTGESSPYLLQHAHNPVDWYPWGKEAFDKAKRGNKMLIISIGYASCHWCHVMEKESFMDEEIAGIMNKNFVCIKVDREERPDVDHVYMNTVQMIHGQGGWPLNCFALPDGSPVWGGTYFRKSQWKEVMEQMAFLYANKAEELEQQTEQIRNGLIKNENIPFDSGKTSLSKTDIDKIYETLSYQLDTVNGGTIGAPKFPMPVLYLFLLRYYHLTGKKELMDHIMLTLKNMAFGGICDQAGGGFARYSTDIKWKVPHFEKMLYDNAQLGSLYSEAYQLTKNVLFKEVVFEILDFIERDMTSPEGAFFSSIDADSEGVEGKYYLWSEQECDELLGNDAAVFKDYFRIGQEGLWEKGNILLRKTDLKSYALYHSLDINQLKDLIKRGKEKLLKERDQRIKPALDDKILTSWNAMMIKAYTDAYAVFNEASYLKKATRAADFILDTLSAPDGGLFHVYKNGKTSINGFLEDYCFTVDAFITLYQSTFDIKWLTEADRLMNYVISNFYDKRALFYINNGKDEKLITRPKELMDTVIPSSNSMIARSLLRLSLYFENHNYREMAENMLSVMKTQLFHHPSAFSNWGMLMMELLHISFIVTILGEEAHEKHIEISSHYLPFKMLAGGKEESTLSHTRNRLVKGMTMIYVCTDRDCRRPTTKVSEAIAQLKSV